MPEDQDVATWVEVDADPAHVRREREKARKLRATAWWRRRLQRGLCAYCGSSFPAAELTMDHIVPLARGGRSVRGNVVASCKPCNARKRLLTPAEQVLLARQALERAGDGEGG